MSYDLALAPPLLLSILVEQCLLDREEKLRESEEGKECQLGFLESPAKPSHPGYL
jgi:hypothetical protein